MTFIKKSMTTSKGFTLIELLLVVAVVGILAAIAMPAYSGYIQKSRRTDATVAIRAVQFAQEKYRGNNTTYGTLAQMACRRRPRAATTPLPSAAPPPPAMW